MAALQELGALWGPVGMPASMSLWWGLFAVDSTALGGAEAHLARGRTITLAGSLIVLQRRGRPGWACTPPPGEAPAVSGVRGN